MSAMAGNGEELKEALALTDRLLEVVSGNPWEVYLVRNLIPVKVELERQLKGGA